MKIYLNKYKIEELDKRICLITDIHFNKKFNQDVLLNIYLELVKLKPDYICIVGDILDEAHISRIREIKILNKFIENLAKVSKVIITLGNHDLWSYRYKCEIDQDRWIKELNKIKNVDVIHNDYIIIDDITFMAFNPSSKYYYIDKEYNIEALKEEYNKLTFMKSKYNILLVHTPINIDKLNLKNIDLVLSGHMHGGLTKCNKEGNDGFVCPRLLLFPKNIRGLIKYKKYKHIISSGITVFSRNSGFSIFSKFYPSEIIVIN